MSQRFIPYPYWFLLQPEPLQPIRPLFNAGFKPDLETSATRKVRRQRPLDMGSKKQPANGQVTGQIAGLAGQNNDEIDNKMASKIYWTGFATSFFASHHAPLSTIIEAIYKLICT